MKTLRVSLVVAVSLLILLLSAGTSASVLAGVSQPPTIEQPVRPIYEPLYFETHGLISENQSISNWNNLEANFMYTAATVQSLDEHAGNKYNYEIYFFGNGYNLNLTNR